MPRRHWHHKVHEEWGRRRLYFWLIRFSKLYPRAEVLAELRRIADDHDVASYVSYELLGDWDLLVRLYMDPFQRPSFVRDLKGRLGSLGFENQRGVEVGEVVRHWVWADGARRVGPPRAPHREALNRVWPRTELRVINGIERPTPRERQLLRGYRDAGLAAVADHRSGMKLAIAVQRRGAAPSEFMYKTLKDDLATALDGAGPWLKERSLYASDPESETPFFLMCRLAHKDFPRVRFELVQPLGDIVEEMGARLTTYPIVSDDFVCFSDRLPPSVVQAAPTDVETLLAGPETQEFEIKGSAFVALDPWLDQSSLPKESNGFFVNTIAKETVAFLNTGGGSLVIGALETKRYGEYPVLAEFERNEYNIGIGILDPTYVTAGWDDWERRIRDLLRQHVRPSVGNEVEIRKVRWRSVEVGLIVVDAVEPDYYLREEKDKSSYWIRVGTSARRLDGEAIERHRRYMRAKLRKLRRQAL